MVPMPPCFDPDLPLTAEPRNIGFNKHDFISLTDSFPSAFTPVVEPRVYKISDRSDSIISNSPSIASDIESVTSGQTSGRTNSESSCSTESESLASLSTDIPLPVPANLQTQVSSVPLIPVRIPSPICSGERPQTEDAISPVSEMKIPVATAISVGTILTTSEDNVEGTSSTSVQPPPPSVSTNVPAAQPEPSTLLQPSASNNVLILTQPEPPSSHQPSASTVAPIATQPEPSRPQRTSVSTNSPIATQPESPNTRAGEENRPATQPLIVTSSVTSSKSTDFVSEVVSGALATAQTAIGVAANASRTAYSTLGTFFTADNDPPPATAYYQIGEQEGDVTLTARGSTAVRL